MLKYFCKARQTSFFFWHRSNCFATNKDESYEYEIKFDLLDAAYSYWCSDEF